jgi:hypothetical protein
MTENDITVVAFDADVLDRWLDRPEIARRLNRLGMELPPDLEVTPLMELSTRDQMRGRNLRTCYRIRPRPALLVHEVRW